MPDELFIRGLVFGFSIAAPVGPIGILCIQRTLNRSLIYGLISGLGAATADAVYGFVAAFGLTLITSFLTSQVNLLRLVGGIFLCYLGLKTFLSTISTYSSSNSTGEAGKAPSIYQGDERRRFSSLKRFDRLLLGETPARAFGKPLVFEKSLIPGFLTESLAGAYLSTFFLTLTNPLTIFSFAAIFVGLGLTASGGNYLAASLLVVGVFVGSGLWWLLLSSGVTLFRSKFDAPRLRWINRGAGLIITGFGLAMLSYLF